MAANCTVHLPAAACAGFPNPRAAFRTLLDDALGDGLEPAVDFPADDLVRVSIYLSSDLAARLRGIAGHRSRPLDEIAAGLAYARFLQRANGMPHDSRQDGRVALQTRLRVPLLAGLRDGKVVFAEGGTGLGRSCV